MPIVDARRSTAAVGVARTSLSMASPTHSCSTMEGGVLVDNLCTASAESRSEVADGDELVVSCSEGEQRAIGVEQDSPSSSSYSRWAAVGDSVYMAIVEARFEAAETTPFSSLSVSVSVDVSSAANNSLGAEFFVATGETAVVGRMRVNGVGSGSVWYLESSMDCLTLSGKLAMRLTSLLALPTKEGFLIDMWKIGCTEKKKGRRGLQTERRLEPILIDLASFPTVRLVTLNSPNDAAEHVF